MSKIKYLWAYELTVRVTIMGMSSEEDRHYIVTESAANLYDAVKKVVEEAEKWCYVQTGNPKQFCCYRVDRFLFEKWQKDNPGSRTLDVIDRNTSQVCYTGLEGYQIIFEAMRQQYEAERNS